MESQGRAVRLLAERLAAPGAAPDGDSRSANGQGPAPGGDVNPARDVVAPHRLEARESTMGRGKRLSARPSPARPVRIPGSPALPRSHPRLPVPTPVPSPASRSRPGSPVPGVLLFRADAKDLDREFPTL